MKGMAILLAAAAIALAAGCSSGNAPAPKGGLDGRAFSAGFADETYVWEGFVFPTNRTERTK